MLDYIRKRSTGIVVKILLGLLIISFAAWGIPNVFRGGGDSNTVAWVGDLEIPPNQLSRELQMLAGRFQSLTGERLNMDQLRAQGLVEGVLGGIVENTLFKLGADDLGVTVSDRLVSDAIRGNPTFTNILGEFDRTILSQFLQSLGLSEQGFIERIRDELEKAQLLGSIMAGGVAPKSLVEAVYRHRRERRIAEVLLIDDRDMTAIGEPDPGALAKFHADNAARFMAPEYRSLTAIRLVADRLADGIAVADEEIKEVFEMREGEFSQPERRQLQQILTADEETAWRIHEKLAEGRDFVEVGKEMAGTDTEFVDIGLVSRDEMLPELAEAAFSLLQDGFSQPLKTLLGWHVIRVTGIEPARKKTLEEVGGEIEDELAREKAIDSLYSLANRLEDELGGGATFEEAAARLDLELIRVDAVDRDGLDAKGNPVAGLPPEGAFLETVFATPEGTESILAEAGPDGYFIVRIDGVTEPALRPLETVADTVAEAWKANQRATAASDLAQTLFARVRGGDRPSAIAEETGLEISITSPFTRNGEGAEEGLPPALIDAVFKIKIGEATMARGKGASYVARLKEVLEANPLTDEDGFKAVDAQITQSLHADLQAQLAGALRGRFPVSFNRRALDQNF